MSSPRSTVFACSFCHVYLPTFDKGKEHLRTKHNLLRLDAYGAIVKNLIRAVAFPILTIPLQRYVDTVQGQSPQTPPLISRPRRQSKRHKRQKTATNGENSIQGVDLNDNTDTDHDLPDLIGNESSASFSSPSGSEDEDVEDANYGSRKRKKSSSNTKGQPARTYVRKTVKRLARQFIDGVWVDKEVDLEDKTGRFSKLKNHKPITLRGTYQCRLCRIEFPAPREFMKHMKDLHLTVHEVTNAPQYTCPHCDARIYPLQLFSRHMKKHEERDGLFAKVQINEGRGNVAEKELKKCDKCHKTFLSMYNYNAHIKNHEKKKDKNGIGCPLCQHKFKRHPEMRRHFLLHLENNPFKCKFPSCTSQFYAWNNLRRHISLHTFRQRFNCPKPNCQAFYGRRDALENHLKKAHSNSEDNSEEEGVGYVPRKGRLYKIKSLKDEINTNKEDEDGDDESDEITGSKNKSKTANKRPNNSNPSQKNQKMNDERRTCKIQGVEEEENDYDLDNIKNEYRVEEESVHLNDCMDTCVADLDDDLKALPRSPSPSVQKSQDENKSEDNDLETEIKFSYSIEKNENKDSKQDTQAPATPEFRLKINQIIQRDPVFQKLLRDSPSAAKALLPPHFCTKISPTASKNKTTLGCPHVNCKWTGEYAYDLHIHLQDQDHKTIGPPKIEPSNGITLICATCGTQSNSAAALANHMKTQHRKGKNKFSCHLCALTFKKMAALGGHLERVHYTEKKFKCSKCPSAFSSSQHLTAHQRKHDPSWKTHLLKNFKCKTCGKQLQSPQGFRQHMKNHSQSKKKKMKVPCNLCGQLYANQNTVKRHIYTMHFKRAKPRFGTALWLQTQKVRQETNGDTGPRGNETVLAPTTPATATDVKENQSEMILGL